MVWVGRWLLSYPAFVAFELYRRGHIAHHRDELGPGRVLAGLLKRIQRRSEITNIGI